MASECDGMDDGFASKAFTKTIQDTSNNTHTGYTPLYTNTFLTIDKRASLSSRSHLAHIAAYKAPQIAHPHALWPFAFAFKCCDAGAELKLERFSDIPDKPCHAMPCWLHHDFSGLLARLLLFFCSFLLSASSLLPCLFTAARID